MIHTVKGFTIVNEGEVDVFLEFPGLFYDSTTFGNLISGSFAFSKSSFYIWKLLVHVLLKPSLKDFEHYLFSMWNEYSCAVVWTFFATAFLWAWNENWPFPVLNLKRIHTVPYKNNENLWIRYNKFVQSWENIWDLWMILYSGFEENLFQGELWIVHFLEYFKQIFE